jgi:precorrin-6B methylase 2
VRLICVVPAPRLASARQRRWPPIVVALLMQAVGAALTVGVAWVLATRGVTLHPLMAALITGVIAAALGRVAGLDPWWIWIQLLFVPAAVLAASMPMPRWVWIALFATLAAVYWSTFRTQVPLYLSSSKVRQALVAQLPAGHFTFMDVGSGLGGVLLDLAAARPDGTYHGIESAPVPWLLSWIRIRLTRRAQCDVSWGSLWNCDLGQYDVVFAYLSPVPMAALWEKVQREMRPGSRFISNTFVVAGEAPSAVVSVDDLHHSTLYVWTHS